MPYCALVGGGALSIVVSTETIAGNSDIACIRNAPLATQAFGSGCSQTLESGNISSANSFTIGNLDDIPESTNISGYSMSDSSLSLALFTKPQARLIAS